MPTYTPNTYTCAKHTYQTQKLTWSRDICSQDLPLSCVNKPLDPLSQRFLSCAPCALAHSPARVCLSVAHSRCLLRAEHQVSTLSLRFIPLHTGCLGTDTHTSWCAYSGSAKLSTTSFCGRRRSGTPRWASPLSASRARCAIPSFLPHICMHM